MSRANPPSSAPSTARATAALFLVSVLGLFLELMLIRWVSTEIRIFAYLQNTVLVVCFLGLGMGCWTCRQPARPRDALLPLFLLTLLLAVPLTRQGLGNISQLFSVLNDFPIWEPSAVTSRGSLIGAVAVATFLTLGLMGLLWQAFVPLGRVLGRLLDDHPRPIWAYSVNVAGSLIGIWLFVLASGFYLPPVAWCAITAALALPFLGRRPIDYALLAAAVGLAAVPELLPTAKDPGGEPNTQTRVEAVRWSPYQKVTLARMETPADGDVYTRYTLQVNNALYLWLLDLRPETVERFPTLFDPELRGHGYYDLPTLLHRRPERMLVVGAGGGNDVAGGLRGGAGRVVAVEIDPAIVAFGKEYHPERPYQDPRVEVVTNDARAYFADGREKFDLIVFGLLDSHTTTGGMTNARLDHYVYTRESFQQAKRLLAEGGTMVLSFAATEVAVADRMGQALRETFGQDPLVFNVPSTYYGLGGVVFVTGHAPRADIDRRVAEQPKLAALIRKWQAEYPLHLPGETAPATDDWPYIYLARPTVPVLFLVLTGLMAVLYLYGTRRLGVSLVPPGRGSAPWHFFFLGAAFMLLETQNISKAAVALGNTWDVNAVIISAIMVFILLANAVAFRVPLGLAYVGLLGTCVGLYFVDLSVFNGLPYATRAVVVGGLTCLPMLFSGMVFARSFAGVPGKDAALGANLLGALAGGLLQSVTFLTGIKALLLIVAGLYALALLTRPRQADEGGGE